MQQDTVKVPAVYIFEGSSLPKVLETAARTIQACRCEGMTSHFVFERPSDPWYRLSIYFHGPFPISSQPDHWERIRFQGVSLPTVLAEMSKYTEECHCQEYVTDLTYERISFVTESIAPLHVTYLVISWPFPN